MRERMAGLHLKIKPMNSMSPQQSQYFNLRSLPARLNVEEVACLLAFKPNCIPLLVAGGLLKPLGHPPVTGVKYFAAVRIEEYRKDEKWLAQASDCIVRYWQTRNKNRKNGDHNIESNEADLR